MQIFYVQFRGSPTYLIKCAIQGYHVKPSRFFFKEELTPKINRFLGSLALTGCSDNRTTQLKAKGLCSRLNNKIRIKTVAALNLVQPLRIFCTEMYRRCC